MEYAWAIPYLPWLGGLLALGCLLASFRNFRRRSLSKELPTSRALGVFMGLVEMKGSAECEAPLVSVLAEAECIHYRYKVEEEWRRTEMDSDGKLKTESGWKTVDEGTQTVPSFYVKDATGAILVRPKGAELDAPVVFNRSCGRDDPVYFGKGPMAEISDSCGRRRFFEEAIRLHGPVYLVGKARERRDIVAAEIAADDTAELFFISGHSEQEVQSTFAWHGVGWSLLGLVLLVGGFMLRDHLREQALVPHLGFYAKIGAAYLGCWVVAWVWNVFNDLVALRNRVREGWGLIDIQLKRRFDLVPNLVRAVEALRDHEREAHAQLAMLRQQAAAPLAGQRALKPVLGVLQEKYPELKSSGNFLALQKQLVETEERIALARDYYNAIATHFNTRIEILPDRFVAALLLARRFDLVASGDFERAPVRVDFGRPAASPSRTPPA